MEELEVYIKEYNEIKQKLKAISEESRKKEVKEMRKQRNREYQKKYYLKNRESRIKLYKENYHKKKQLKNDLNKTENSK